MSIDYLKIYLTCFCYLTSQIAISQDFNINSFDITNLTIEDGLPSNECHDLVQDSLGYIWIATDRGLVRFDGYGFKKYDFSNGLKNISCLALQLDSNNLDVWIATYGGQLFQYQNQIDSIIPYKYNSLIKSYGDNLLTSEFYVNKNGAVYCNLTRIGMLKIEPDGNAEIVKPPCKNIVSYVFEVDEFSTVCTLPVETFNQGLLDKSWFCYRSKFYEYILNRKAIGHPFVYKFKDSGAVLTGSAHRYFF